MGRLSLILGALVIALAVPSHATVIHFDDLFTPANGLTHSGVTFGFKVAGLSSSDLTYGGAGPGTLTYVDDPSLEGDAAGELTLDFVGGGITTLSFGVGLDYFGPLNPGFTVQLFDALLSPAGVFNVPTDSLVFSSEGLFQYSGAGISRAVVTFNSAAAGRFALDNLTFEAAASGVPEPTTLVLTGLGITIAAMRTTLRRGK